MIYILNRDYEVYRNLDIDYKFSPELNKLNTLEFTTDIEISKGDYVVLKDDEKYYEFVIVDSDYNRENQYSFDYYCQDTLLEINGCVIDDKKPNRNAIKHLEIIFSDTGWEIVNKGDFTTSEVQINYYRINVLEAFKKVLETFEIEWETNFIVDNGVIVRRQLIIGKVGKRVNSRLEFGKNIQKFNRKILPDPIYTALIGLGKGEEKTDKDGNSTGGYGRRITFADVNNGSWFVGNEEARLKYGIGGKGNKKHYFGFVKFEDETDKEKLLELTKKELKKVSRPQAEYTIDVANINIDVNLGDEVPAIDEVLGFRDYLRVIKVEKTKLSTELIFGVMTKAFSSLSNISGESIAEKVTEMVGSRFNEEINRAINNFNNEDGYNYDLKAGNKYNLPAGYYSFNKPIGENPTKVTYMGAGKVMIADEKGSDGSWKWKTAIDGSGIAGSEIFANSITANKLASDIGQGIDISSNAYIQSIVESNNTLSEDTLNALSELNQSLNGLTTEEDVQKLIDELNTKINQNKLEITQTNDSFTQEYSRIEANIESNRAELEKITGVIQSGLDENGNTYTDWIGDDENRVRVGSDGIVMLSNNAETLKLKDGGGYMNSLYVEHELGLGNHTARKMGTEFTVFMPIGGQK